MSFGWPAALVGLLLIPLALVVYAVMQRRRQRYAVRFTNVDLLANIVEDSPGWRRHIPAALYVLALAAMLVAVAKPQRSVNVPREEATVILVMDVSGSMTATDVEPTRLAAAQVAAGELVDKLPERFRVSLVSFSSGVNIMVAPTEDRQAFKDALARLRARGGTAMGDAIIQALDLARPPEAPPAVGANAGPTPMPTAVPKDQVTPAVIVLLSDGFNTAGVNQPVDAAAEAKDLGVPVFTIALGTDQGIAEVEDNAGRTRRVPVPPDADTLRQVAQITDGKFFEAPSAKDLRDVYDELGSKIGYKKEQREVTHWFAGAAAALVLAAGGLSLAWFNRFP